MWDALIKAGEEEYICCQNVWVFRFMLLLTEKESCFSKRGACAYLSVIGVHRGECVNGSSLGFYQNAWVFFTC